VVFLVILLACAAGASADVIAGDRAALVDFYTATGGPTVWIHHDYWNTGVSVCFWSGVKCSADGSRVARLCVVARSFFMSDREDLWFDGALTWRSHVAGKYHSKL
jgi:hypothetical protein